MEMLQGVWKQHLRPLAVVGYGVKIFLPSPPNYVTRSPGKGPAPHHSSELLVVKPRTRYSLRSDYETLLVIPKVTWKTFGDQAFSHARPTVWNA